ncbi:probetacellulin isoform X2 [Haemorhous mexicanus]|uniref:probetacellulin isoform X2 n=1 Tax=Haemorhous mexicanus TaxID=30427 RepID=UPI0028BDC04D|nr:probetacellulin isoform X2 [Haemorhous mexicanus]
MRERLLVLCYLYLRRTASVSAGLSPGLCWDLHAGNGAVSLDLLLRGPGWSWLLTPATWSYSLWLPCALTPPAKQSCRWKDTIHVHIIHVTGDSVWSQRGLALFSCVGADTNVTAGHGAEGLSCGTAKGCTGNGTQPRRQSHFSRCPEEYQHYCVKGRCRFLVAEQAPACVCERGYTGARCERVDLFYLRGDQGQIVIISLIVAIAALIILVVGICLCSHHCRRQRRKRKAEEMETLNKDGPSRSEDVRETGIA